MQNLKLLGGMNTEGQFAIGENKKRWFFVDKEISSYILELQDKLHRRNMQIKELKKEKEELQDDLFHARMDIQVYKRDLNQ